MVGNVIENGFLKVSHAAEAFPADALLGDFGKEPFDLVEPAAVGWDEVQMPAGMLGDPQPHPGGLVRGIIIQHGMDFQVFGRGRFQLPQEG